MAKGHNSVQKWRKAYIVGGIEKMLEYNMGVFKPTLITTEVHKKIEEKLTNPLEAFRSFEELRQWIDKDFVPDIKYHAVNKYVKHKFGAKLKVARKSHIQKEKNKWRS